MLEIIGKGESMQSLESARSPVYGATIPAYCGMAGMSSRRLVSEKYDVKIIDNIIRGYCLSAAEKE